MEFYLYNKDDRKLKTLVNLATIFKVGEINYIVYYNTQTEKSVIDIYIGKISYGDECLVINKIDAEKQGEFLSIIKDILASKNPETADSDYQNIIDTATIVLEEVQKIQIPTSGLDILLNYRKKTEPSMEEIVPETNTDINSSKNMTGLESNSVGISINNAELENEAVTSHLSTTDMNSENKNDFVENEQSVSHEKNGNVSNLDSTYMRGNDKLNDLDNLINEQQSKHVKKEESKKDKKISTPILVMLILVVIIAVALIIIEKMM